MQADLSDFLAPLEPSVILMAVVLGGSIGVAIASVSRTSSQAHLYWMLGGGVVFFVPLALLRAFQGSPVWERFLATLPLWVCFVLGVYAGERLYRRFTRRP